MEKKDAPDYAKVLRDFISPYEYMTKNEGINALYDLANDAWNMANMISLLPTQEFETQLMESAEYYGENFDIIRKMVARKIESFIEYDQFVFEIDVIEGDSDYVISVNTKNLEDYMAAVQPEDPESIEEIFEGMDPFEEKGLLNRNAVLVKFKKSFWVWLATKIDVKADFQEIYDDTEVFLIDIEESPKQWMKNNYLTILDKQLENFFEVDEIDDLDLGWSYKDFKKRFKIDYSVMVLDLEDQPLL